MIATPLQAGLYALSAALVAATVVWPSWTAQHSPSRAQAAADATAQGIAGSERAAFALHGRYALFGPVPAERQTALPGLDLGAADTDFTTSAVLDRGGVLRIRVASRPEAVRAGRTAPVLAAVDLASPSRPGSASSVPDTGQ